MAAIDFRKSALPTTATAAPQERAKAQYWLNVGYTVQEQTDEGIVDTFISLPLGIPLDDQKTLPTNSSNARYAALSSARNSLYEQLMAVCAELGDGEEQLLDLQIQVRKVRSEQATVSAGENPFLKKLF